MPRSDRTADALLETDFDGEAHLVEVELQAQRDPTFSRRLLDYAVRAHLRDGLPVLPVVIYVIPEAEGARPPYVMRAKRRDVVRFDFMLDSPFWEEQREKVRRETALELLRKIAQNRGGSWSDAVHDRLLLLNAEQIEQLTLRVAAASDSASVDRILEATQQ